MIRYLTGLVTATLAGCAGGWLMLAPFALGIQPATTTWTDDTRVEFFTGLGVAVLAALIVLAWAIAWVRRLRADGVLPSAAEPHPDRDSPPVIGTRGEPPTVTELHDLLAPLVAALAADLHAQNPPASASSTAPAQPTGTREPRSAATGTGGSR
jgi:hypothetical protein